jgi:phytoene synthase
LPREALLEAGIVSTDPLKVISDPGLPKACAPLTERARAHFEKADEVMDRNRRRVVRAPRIMSKYYRAILELLVARGFAAPRAPVRLNKVARIAIVVRYALI